jgi:hypothetical protein
MNKDSNFMNGFSTEQVRIKFQIVPCAASGGVSILFLCAAVNEWIFDGDA